MVGSVFPVMYVPHGSAHYLHRLFTEHRLGLGAMYNTLISNDTDNVAYFCRDKSGSTKQRLILVSSISYSNAVQYLEVNTHF